MNALTKAIGGFLGLMLLAGAVAGYGATDTREIGYPGVAMQITDSEDNLAAKWEANRGESFEPGQIALTDYLAPQGEPGPNDELAVNAYENVHVLGHLSTGQFTRVMNAMSNWVQVNLPQEEQKGCAYCHVQNADGTFNHASDEMYQKVVSRRMLQMTQHINENWQTHVGQTGVTCWTCHRGRPVPEYVWFNQPEDSAATLGNRANQNMPSYSAGLASLPGNAFPTFLDGEANIRVQSDQPLPGDNRRSIKQAEWTYALMMHFSNSLGVNCTYCHNSRSWADWSQSPAQRGTAWYGIRMVRNVNHEYMASLQDVFPEIGWDGQRRLGPLGDVAKTNCMTCHQGAYKPLLGYPMLERWPALAAHVQQPEPDVEEEEAILEDVLEDETTVEESGEGESADGDAAAAAEGPAAAAPVRPAPPSSAAMAGAPAAAAAMQAPTPMEAPAAAAEAPAAATVAPAPAAE